MNAAFLRRSRHHGDGVVIAQRREEAGHAWVADLPQPGHDFRLVLWWQIGQQLGDNILRVGLFEQASPEVDEQPGPIGGVKRHLLAVLDHPDGRMRAQQRPVERAPDLIDRGHSDPVEHRERGATLARRTSSGRVDQFCCGLRRIARSEPGSDLRLAILGIAVRQRGQQAVCALAPRRAEHGHMPALRPEPAVHAPGSERRERDREAAVGFLGSQLDHAKVGERLERERERRALIRACPADAGPGVPWPPVVAPAGLNWPGRNELDRRYACSAVAHQAAGRPAAGSRLVRGRWRHGAGWAGPGARRGPAADAYASKRPSIPTGTADGVERGCDPVQLLRVQDDPQSCVPDLQDRLCLAVREAPPPDLASVASCPASEAAAVTTLPGSPDLSGRQIERGRGRVDGCVVKLAARGCLSTLRPQLGPLA